MALVLALGFLLGLRPLADNNIDFHLHGGQGILQHRAVPATDTYTYGAHGRPYIDLHWLFQLAVYGIYRVGGFAALSLTNAALAAGLLAVLALRLRRLGAGPASSCWVLLAAAIAVHHRFLMRPENVTFLFLALVGLVLDRHVATLAAAGVPGGTGAGQSRGRAPLWVVPLIHLAWVNTQGLFALGWLLTGAYLAGIRIRYRRWDRALAAALAASVAVSLLNPYGLKGLLFPLELLSRFDRANVFARNIGEFQPLLATAPLFEDKVLAGFTLLLLAALVVARKRMEPHEFLLLPPFLVLALAAVRNVPLFVVVAAPILGKALTLAAATVLPAGVRRSSAPAGVTILPRARAAGAILCSVLVVGVALRVLTGAFYELPGGGALFRFGVGLDEGARPVAAGRFLLDHGLDGRILNSSNIGGWLGWVLPHPVYLDMRLEVIGEDLYREEERSWAAGGLTALITKYRPQLIVFDHHGGTHGWTPQLRVLPDWRLIFLDEATAVYARAGYAPSLPPIDLDALPGALGVRAPEDHMTETLLRQRVPGRARRWLEGFVRRAGRPNPWRDLGRYCASQGAVASAERFFLAGLAADPVGGRALLGDLGSLFASTGRWEKARLAFDRYLEYDPRAVWAGNARGTVRAQAGDLEGAIGDFSRVIEHEPRSATAYRNRGLVREALGDLAGARGDFASALAIDPADERVRQEIAAIDAVLAAAARTGESHPGLR